MSGSSFALAVRIAIAALLAALALAAGCDGGGGYESDGDLWHEVSFETTKLV